MQRSEKRTTDGPEWPPAGRNAFAPHRHHGDAVRARLEDIDAGPVPVAGTDEYSDVTAIDADGNRIAPNRVPHFHDAAMRDLMHQARNRLYTFHARLDESL